MIASKALEPREYNGEWQVGDIPVNPPCAYTSVEAWLDHISTLAANYKKAIAHLRATPQTSTLYPHMQTHLYYKILDHLDANYAR